MDLHEHLAERIAQMRHDRGWSAAELARRVTETGVKMSRATVSKLEMRPDRSGARPPTVVELLAISYVLDASPLALLLPLRQSPVAMFGEVELDYGSALNWLTHTGAPEGVDPKRFQFVAPDELAEVNEVSRATGLDIVQMAQTVLDMFQEAQIEEGRR